MRILALAIFPAPYRVAVFDELGRDVELDAVFEHSNEATRASSWFTQSFAMFSATALDNRSRESRTKLARVAQKLLSNDYDAVLVYDYSTIRAQLLIVLLRALRVPYILNCDGALPTSGGRLKAVLKSSAIRHASACLASGSMAAAYFLRHGATSSKIFYHPFTSLFSTEILQEVPDAAAKTMLRAKLGIDGRIVTITASRLIASKRIDSLIRSWEHMPPDHCLLIAGAGAEEDRYRKLAKDLSLTNVQFLGHLERPVLFDYFDASDVFVLPTESDTWGLVVNEAMARGLPVITTDGCVAGLELITSGQNGLLVPVGDQEALISALRNVHSDPALLSRMARDAIDRISPYTYENVAKSHLVALKRVIRR